MDLGLRTTAKYVTDRSWLADGLGIHTFKGTLDYSAFTEGTHFPNGYFPAGLGLRKLDSGLYGPATAVDNETQTITVNATGGTFTISVAGETTAALDFDSTAAEVQTALEDLANIQPGDISVSGGPGATAALVLTFGGALGGENVPQVTTAAGSLTGGASTAVVATSNAGSGSGGTPAGLLWDAEDAAGARDIQVAIMDEGHIKSANLPTGHGWNAEMAAALPGIRDYS